jgi:thioredoxin-like negative regulator of GroEL
VNDVLTWGALIAAGGSITAVVTFWLNRGKAEAEATARAEAAALKADGALQMASTAISKVNALTAQLSEARIEFARDYASHHDLAESEARYAAALEGLRTELRGMNARLDRIIETLISRSETK